MNVSVYSPKQCSKIVHLWWQKTQEKGFWKQIGTDPNPDVWRSSAVLCTLSSIGLISRLFFISEWVTLCRNFQFKLKMKSQKNSWGIMKRHCGPASVFWGGRRRKGRRTNRPQRARIFATGNCSLLHQLYSPWRPTLLTLLTTSTTWVTLVIYTSGHRSQDFLSKTLIDITWICLVSSHRHAGWHFSVVKHWQWHWNKFPIPVYLVTSLKKFY